MEQRKTSIIILAYKEFEKFKKMFETLLKHTHQEKTPFEIVIVDNNCDQKIREFYLAQDQSFIRWIQFADNQGTSKGFNQGALLARGHYLCFFNSDYYMNDNWLESMIDCFEHQSNIGLTSCCTNHSGNIDEKHFDNTYKEAYCAIAQMFTTKKIWEEVNGFNEDLYPIEFEDLDFNERIKAKGYRIFVNRKTFGFHDMDKTKGKLRRTQRTRNRNIFYKTWGKKHTWA